MVIEIVDLPTKNGDFQQLCKRLPEGIIIYSLCSDEFPLKPLLCGDHFNRCESRRCFSISSRRFISCSICPRLGSQELPRLRLLFHNIMKNRERTWKNIEYLKCLEQIHFNNLSSKDLSKGVAWICVPCFFPHTEGTLCHVRAGSRNHNMPC